MRQAEVQVGGPFEECNRASGWTYLEDNGEQARVLKNPRRGGRGGAVG